MNAHADMTTVAPGIASIYSDAVSIIDVVRTQSSADVTQNTVNWLAQRAGGFNAFTRILSGTIPGALGAITVAMKRIGYLGEQTDPPSIEVSGAAPLTQNATYTSTTTDVALSMEDSPGVAKQGTTQRISWYYSIPVIYTADQVTVNVIQQQEDPLQEGVQQLADYTVVLNAYSGLSEVAALSWHHANAIPGLEVPEEDWVVVPMGFERNCLVCRGSGREHKEWPYLR